MSRWERQLADEEDETRRELAERTRAEGDAGRGFTNVPLTMLKWGLIVVGCAVLALAIAAILFILGTATNVARVIR